MSPHTSQLRSRHNPPQRCDVSVYLFLRHSITPSLRHFRRGFTLAELIVAIVMLGFLAGATYLSVSQMIRSRDRSAARAEAFGRANLAADLIARDVTNALRDSDLLNAKVAITREGKPGQGLDGVLLFSHIDRPIRPGAIQAEGDEAEVQYKLRPAEGLSAKPGSMVLWMRRAPVPDEYPDAGGVATPLVEGVMSLTMQAYDGTTWIDEWDSDLDGLPHALRVVVAAADDRGQDTITARRIIAMDRVPIPPEEDTTATETNTTGTGTTGGGS